ncbi:MAG TPA: ADP-ribosyltransferase, partial [Bacilli bacterium]|nr:ADP-ribosyltransferase [Bacilli bacterium]
MVNTIKLNYNCPDSEKNGSGPGSCGGNTDSKINLNPEIAPADYNSFFENFNKISKDKSEPDRIMRRLNAETVQRRFYRKTEEHFNEIKPENDKKLKENGEKLWDNLRPEVQSAIKSYTTQDYGVINSALQDDITREEVLLLKEATSKPLGVRTILYRGINFKMPKDIFKVGATWIHKPFASCSTGSFIAEEAASGKLTHITPEEKTILQIFTEPETKGFAVGKNSFHAGADAGSEVILDAGTKFQTIHSEKRGGMRILTVRAINDEQKQDSSYLEDVTNFIKLNYKCPKGTVDDSNKCDIEKPIVNIPIPNKFKDIDNVKSDKIRGESSEFLNQLVQNNEYLVNSLKSYTNIGHLEVNKYLGNRISGNIPKEIEKIIIGLDSIFNLQKEQNFLTSSSITTYRGVSDIEIENLLGLNQKHIYDIEPGKIITDPKFVSTTLNKEQALQFGRDRYGGSIITILIPKNSEALHTESVSGSEDELLINRNQSYKFLGVNKNIDNSGLDSNKPVHEFIFELVNANQKQ